MEFYNVAVEGHSQSTTIYVAGLLLESAGTRVEELVQEAPASTRTVRLDLRAVQLIDPASFVRIARLLAAWRDTTRGHVYIEFPSRAARQPACA